jgi:hypothetical protein
MGMLDLFDEAFDLYKKNLGLLLLIVGIVYVPAVGVGTYVIMPAVKDMIADTPGDFDGVMAWLGPYVGPLGVVAPLAAVLAALAISALTAAVCARYLGEPITLRESFRRSLPLIAPVAVGFLVYFVLVSFGYAMCVVPGFIVQACCIPLQFFIQALVVENSKGLFKGLSRSFNLAKGQGSHLLGAHSVHWFLWMVLMLATIGVIQLIAELAVRSAIPLLPLLAAHTDLSSVIGTELAIMILMPFQVCVVSILYFDLRIRKEGYDMEILAQSLGYPPVELPPAAKLPKAATARKGARP